MAFQFSISIPTAGPYPTGVLINNGAGYAAGTATAMTTDGGNASHAFPVGSTVMAKDVNARSNPLRVLGAVTANSATTVRIGAGTKFAVTDNLELYCIDSATVVYKLAKEYAATASFTFGANTFVQVSDDGRGNLIYVYSDFA